MVKQAQSRFEIDQSIRIEELNKDTIIGIGNKKEEFAVTLPRKIKRHFNEQFRRYGISKRLGPILFAVSVIVAIKKLRLQPSSLTIDIEYPGYDRIISKLIGKYYPKTVISFKQIGKHSPAHKACYFSHTGKRQTDDNISRRDIDPLITKTTGELLHLEFTRIRSPRRSVIKKYKKKRQ